MSDFTWVNIPLTTEEIANLRDAIENIDFGNHSNLIKHSSNLLTIALIIDKIVTPN